MKTDCYYFPPPVLEVDFGDLTTEQMGDLSVFGRLAGLFLLCMALFGSTGCAFISSVTSFELGSAAEGPPVRFREIPVKKDGKRRSVEIVRPRMLPRFDRVRPDEVRDEYVRLDGNLGRGLVLTMEKARPQLKPLAGILARHAIPSDLLIIPFVESHFRPHVRSPRGAVGLWQFTKTTGKHHGLKINLFVDERKDPRKSTEAAARLLRELYDEFHDWPLALAAYNGGITRVRKACRGRPVCDYWVLIREKALPPQTRRYVPRLLASLMFLEDRGLWPFTAPRGETP